MIERPEYFNIEHVVNNYTFYKNEQDRVYVPENEEDFNKFIKVLFDSITNPTEEQINNYNFILKYPFLLPKNRWDKGLSIDGDYGFDFTYNEIETMPSGWMKAFGQQMLDEIRDFMLKTKPEFLYQYMITDIKEKYGGLRWYDYGTPKGMYEIINKYEKLSYEICIKCGVPATHMTEGWIMPLCDGCDTK
jgi:hypothetical protein